MWRMLIPDAWKCTKIPKIPDFSTHQHQLYTSTAWTSVELAQFYIAESRESNH